VENILMAAQKALERKYALAAEGVDLDQLLQIVGRLMSVDPRRIPGTSKLRDIVKARSLVCYWGAAELGLTLTEMAKRLGISLSTASVAAQRGEQLALENQYSLMEWINVEI
jgi:chromosomal replication initiation ATPase DnaA